jgi:predicted small secreted protein
MKKTIFVVISCLLLLGLVLAGCGEGGGYGAGSPICVWPNNGSWMTQNAMSRFVVGLNWTDLEYPGTHDIEIPQAWLDEWDTW